MFKKSKKLLAGFISATMIMTMTIGLFGFTASAAGSILTVGSGKTYATIQAAINAASPNDTIVVSAGTYDENVTVNKVVTIVGAGASSTKIVATNANSNPLTFSANGATVDGFTITHDYTVAELASWNFNNNGVAFNQNTTGNTLENSIVSLSRNGIYLNNCQGNRIIDNVITNNRTGINMTNNYSQTIITGNTISKNWTIGIVMYAQGIAADLSTVIVNGNTFDQNWYTEVEIKDSSVCTGTLNVTNNTFTDSPMTYSTSSSTALNEPGFAAQKPNVPGIGGTATKPAQDLPTLRIYNSGSVVLKYTSPKTLVVGENDSIQSAIDAAGDGDTINVAAGTYDAPLIITGKNITIQGVAGTFIVSSVSPPAVSTSDSHGKNPIIFAEGSTLVLKNLTVKAGSIPQYGSIDGITANNSNITLDNVTVTNILNAEGYNGMQYGRGLTALGTSTVVVTNSSFDKFNKNGIHLIGSGVTATITNSTFTGNNNAQNAAAQNGVVFMNGATGLVTGCTFTDFSYPVPAVATATGVLAYDAGAGITLRNNKFINDQDPVDNVTDNKTTPPVVDATMNYWGSAAPNFASLITSPYVTHTLWYTDAAVTELNNAVYSVTLNETTSTLIVGEKLTLVATVAAGADANKTVTWASSNEQVATVDSNGHVTAAGVGNATIIATAGPKTASDKITVTATIPDQGTPGAAAPTTSDKGTTISDNTTPLSSNPLTGDKGTAIPLIAALSCLLAIAGVTFGGIIRKKRRHE